MCGIAGFVGPGDRVLLERMTARIAHRGPDSDGYLVDAAAGVHLGHRRLSILDHQGGTQPMHSMEGALSIIFNGEIYNFRELRKELERLGAQFRSDHSDTEVLLHAYQHWGEAMVDRLNGMWAFVLYDRTRRRLFCSRDRFGKKPFYYLSAPHRFIFASELTALREHPDVSATLNQTALRKYFAYGFVPAPLTLVQGITKLPGGCSLIHDLAEGSTRVLRYWRYTPEPDEGWLARPVAEVAEALVSCLDAAIRRRLVADVPVGAFLSGGLDSSMVSALAIRHTGRHRLTTFSVGFDEGGFDESRFARIVANHISVDHHVGRVSVDSARQSLPQLLAQLDDPVADSSILPTWLLCGYARKKVTVAIGGDGADELFAGYDPFKALRYARRYRSLVPRPLHRAIAALTARMPVSHGYMSLDFRIKRMWRGLDHGPACWLPVWMAPLSVAELSDLFGQPVEVDEVFSEAIESWERFPGLGDVDRATCHFVDLYLQDDILAKIDRASMLHSLEVRSPFLDIALVDFARRLPASLKLRGGTTKWILKRAADRLLPNIIVHRRKQGFALPVGRWFQRDGLGDGISPVASRAPFWQRRLEDHRSGRVDHRLYLWAETVLSGGPLGYDR